MQREPRKKLHKKKPGTEIHSEKETWTGTALSLGGFATGRTRTGAPLPVFTKHFTGGRVCPDGPRDRVVLAGAAESAAAAAAPTAATITSTAATAVATSTTNATDRTAAAFGRHL